MNRTYSILALLVCMVLVAGCGSGQRTVAEIKDSNIKKVHALYSFYMANNGYTGPASEEVFKEWLNGTDGQFAIKRMKMDPDKTEEYFSSERDKEPFVIRYGLKGVADHAIVFESIGFEGKRMVALGTPVELDEEEYEEYLKGEVEGDRPEDGAGFEEETE